MWASEGVQPHPVPSLCVTPQPTLWCLSSSWAPSSPTRTLKLKIYPHRKKTQQRLYFLLHLKKFSLPEMMVVYGALSHNQVHIHLLHHHLGYCYHCQQQGQTAANLLLCWGGYQLQSVTPPEATHLQDPKVCDWGWLWLFPPTLDAIFSDRPLWQEAAIH